MLAATAAVALVEASRPLSDGLAPVLDGDAAAPVRDLEAGDVTSHGSGEEQRAKADSFAVSR